MNATTYQPLPDAGAFRCRTCELAPVPSANRSCFECSVEAVAAWKWERDERRRIAALPKKHRATAYAPHRGKR